MSSQTSSPIRFNVAYIKLCTNLEGPYKRLCIWFQGCNIHCKGCCNQALLPLIPKHIITLEKLLDVIKEAKRDFDIEGITLTGGEPTLQTGLVILNKEVRKLGLGIIMFTGHYKEELPKNLVSSVDLLLEGPYDFTKPENNRLLIGSLNKKITPISNRYTNDLDYYKTSIHKEEVEVDDYIFINGN